MFEKKQTLKKEINQPIPIIMLPLLNDKFAMPLNILALSIFGDAIKNKLEKAPEHKLL